MALGVYFHPASMNATQYDEAIKRLDEAGAGTPKGRLYHICFGTGDQLQVFDVWESQETFDAFGATLMPILEALDVKVNEPMVAHVHNVIEG